jgi:hypothetical protein
VDCIASDAPTLRLSDIAENYRKRNAGSSVPLRTRLLLNIPGECIMRGHTLDIAEDRLTVTLPSPLKIGQECAVFFAITIADHTFAIVGQGQVLNCTVNDKGAYCVDMSFAVEDKKSRIAVEQLFGTKESNRIQ